MVGFSGRDQAERLAGLKMARHCSVEAETKKRFIKEKPQGSHCQQREKKGRGRGSTKEQQPHTACE
jgi:hypothetical protein